MWLKVQTTAIDAMMTRDVKQGLHISRKYIASVAALTRRLVAGQRKTVVKFGLKATFGDHKEVHAKNWIGCPRQNSAMRKKADCAQRKNWRIAARSGQVAVTIIEWYGPPPLNLKVAVFDINIYHLGYNNSFTLQ